MRRRLARSCFELLNIMALPFLKSTASKGRDQLFAVDLGGRTTKAAYLQRKDQNYSLSKFALADAPIFEKTWSVELLSDHLKSITQIIAPTTRQVTIALGLNDLVVRNVEMPLMPVDEMRQILKINTKAYLQQDLPGYVFDCYILPQAPGAQKNAIKGESRKTKVLVAGAKQTFVNDLQTAIRNAGLTPDFVIPGLIGPVNAFERAMPEVFQSEVIALVDIGFKNTTICLLQEGELILTRSVNIGGDKLTSGLAELMNITYAEAEGIKIGMPGEVQPQLEMLVSPLGRELRASIDFFEHQQDRVVSQIYLAGGSARSETIVQTLHTELAVQCNSWNPTSFLNLALPPDQAAEVEQVAPQLTVAVGAALTAI
jgi:type IV pilus assembly protein PilM